MPTLPSKEVLKSMMYRDLQKICKDWGVRANLKSEELIDLLLRAQSKNTPALAPPTKQRSVSTRRTSEDGPSQASSIVTQDLPKETAQQQPSEPTAPHVITDPAAVPLLPAPTRARKAKESQKRLGVGRPVAVGGSGPRAVTRSATISREKKLRSSRSTIQSEATIREELETLNNSHPQQVGLSRHSQSMTETPEGETILLEKEKEVGITSTILDYQTLLTSIVKPLQDQIETLRAEVRRLQDLETEFYRFRKSISHAIIPRLNASVAQTEERSSAQEHLLSRPTPLTPITSLQRVHSDPQLSPSTRQGISPILLGKRSRKAFTGNSPIVEDDDEQEVFRSSLGRPQKRPKPSGEALSNKGKEVARDEVSRPPESESRNSPMMIPRAASFIVYNDIDEGQSPPTVPSNTLAPYYYQSRLDDVPGSPRQGHATSSANAPENQNPFNFSFVPAPPTPGPSLFMAPLPYPEPPQSPTPSGPSLSGSLGSATERTDVFKSFGMPPPDRAGRLPGPSSEATINPAALSQRSSSEKKPQPSSNEIGAGLGLLPSLPSGSNTSPEKELPTTKKTMYGTELEGDTRFGDFGVGGVATGFWAGSRF